MKICGNVKYWNRKYLYLWKPLVEVSKAALLVGGKRKALLQVDSNHPNLRVQSGLAELSSENLFPLPIERILSLNAVFF